MDFKKFLQEKYDYYFKVPQKKTTNTENNHNDSKEDLSSLIDKVEKKQEDFTNEKPLKKVTKKNKKDNTKFYFIIFFILFILYMTIKSFIQSNNQEQSIQKQNEVQEQTKKYIEPPKEVTEESVKTNKIKENTIKEEKIQDNFVQETAKTNKNFISWKKNVIASLGDTNIVDFFLEDKYPQIITRNFKQDGVRNNLITGTDAKIEKIYLKTSNDFLNIVVKIISEDKTKSFELEYPLLKYAQLYFYEDSVVKVFGKNNLILTEDSYIFPYLKIEKISKDKDGAYILFYVKQSEYGAEDFVFRYNIKSN